MFRGTSKWDVVFTVLKQAEPWILQGATTLVFCTCNEIVTEVAVDLKRHGCRCEFTPDFQFKSDKEVVLAAVNRNGFNLQFAAVILKSDKEVVLAAVN